PATAAAAVPPPSPVPDAAPVKLGFDSYSIRAFHWKASRLLEYTAAQKLDTIQLSSLDDYESFEPKYLAKVKDEAARQNITIDAGMGCICPTSAGFAKDGPPARERVLQGLRVAKAVGSTSMRCYMGNAADRVGKLPIEAHME